MSISSNLRLGAWRSHTILIAAWLAIFLLFKQHHLSLDFEAAEAVLLLGSFLIVLSKLLQMRAIERAGMLLEFIPLFLIISLSFTLVGAGIAAGSITTTDDTLAAADRLLFPFWVWPEVARMVGGERSLTSEVANFAYGSMGWQALLVVTLAAFRKSRSAFDSFVVAWSSALSVTMIVYAFWPAAGAYHYYSMSHLDVPAINAAVGWRQAEILQLLQDGSITTVSWNTLEGMVSFPSFHTAAAVILTRSFWTYKLLRWPGVLLNVIMAGSAVACGGHYFVDILAGAGVGLLSLMLLEQEKFTLRLRRAFGALPLKLGQHDRKGNPATLRQGA